MWSRPSLTSDSSTRNFGPGKGKEARKGCGPLFGNQRIAGESRLYVGWPPRPSRASCSQVGWGTFTAKAAAAYPYRTDRACRVEITVFIGVFLALSRSRPLGAAGQLNVAPGQSVVIAVDLLIEGLGVKGPRRACHAGDHR